VKYRQWKKNYKKKHGVNPPLWLDRKKRRRYIRKRVRRIAASLEVNVEIITKGLEASVMAIKKRLIELQERIVARESEAVENDSYFTGNYSIGIAGYIFKAGQTGRGEQKA
jgi:hypothetical protein